MRAPRFAAVRPAETAAGLPADVAGACRTPRPPGQEVLAAGRAHLARDAVGEGAPAVGCLVGPVLDTERGPGRSCRGAAPATAERDGIATRPRAGTANPSYP